jgi:hypothetical protein
MKKQVHDKNRNKNQSKSYVSENKTGYVEID